ncbi:MAG: gliding motility-associated C-terminal domain-containing protein [Flavobacteriales bacterium]|nr:gliding motility-associated C-terminal domain-containing protein [Flavobacteriales bacterium]
MQATHIVGGDFYYKKIGTDQYLVTLKLYIDCQNGDSTAIRSDETAIVSIWDAGSNSYIRQEDFFRTGPTYLSKIHYQCLIPPQDACVSQYIYTKSIDINPGTSGVILAFQRCCRNHTINNIVNPEATGATYWVKIPGTETTTYNNSAVFKELPPNYLCTDAPLKFDHSASDPDGDSLVYELYQPYSGASQDRPRPDNKGAGLFKAPPFNNIIWGNSFATSNQVTGNPKMEINPKTGEITLLPTTVGQYVIGIKVKEYRNGVLVGETYRDYQFNVRECTTTLVANFITAAGSSAFTYNCSDTVNFLNKSLKAKEYRWEFGDPTTDADTSHDVNPTWIYPGNGTYTVKLHAKNDLCEADYEFKVNIKSKIDIKLGPDQYFCDSSVNVFLTPNIFDATKIVWNNGKITPILSVNRIGRYVATAYYGNCKGSDTIDLKLDLPVFTITPDSLFCSEEAIDLDLVATGQPNYKYLWSTSSVDTFSKVHVGKSGYYWVKVTNPRGCSKYDTSLVYVSYKPNLGPDLFICNEFSKIYDAGKRPDTYLWNDGSTGRFKEINAEGKYWVTVWEKHCKSSDTFYIENPIIRLELGNDTNYCDNLYRLMVAPPAMAEYLWYDNSTLETNTVTTPGKYYVWVKDTNGCEKSDTIRLTLTNSPEFELGNDTAICLREAVTIGTPKKFLHYQWNSGSNEPYITTQDSGNHILKVVDENGCFTYDTLHVAIDVNAMPNELFIANAFSPNGDGLNETFPFSEIILQPEYHFRVFNRWGEKLFDTEDSEAQFWDGTYKGKRVKLDAYIYLIDYRACNGEFKRVSGTINVME